MQRQSTTTISLVSLLCVLCTACPMIPNHKTITILGENSGNLQSMEKIAHEFEADLGVSLEFKPNTFEDAFRKANQDFSNKTGLYDIVLQYNFSMSSFVRNKYVYTIDELGKTIPEARKQFESDLFQNVWKETGYYYKDPSKPSGDFVKVGYPFAANTMLLVYNKPLFEDPNNRQNYLSRYHEGLTIPKDWDHFRRVAEFFTNAARDTFGVCLTGADGGWLYYEYCDMLYGMDGAVFNKQYGWEGDSSTPLQLHTTQAQNATAYFKSLKPFNAGDFVNTDADKQAAIMKDGKVAMAIMWSDYLYGFLYGESGDKIEDQFGFAPVPGTKSPLAGGIFYINRQSEHAQEAAQYIMTMMQRTYQIKLAERGLCTPLRSAYDDPEVQKRIPYAAALKASLDRGVYMFEAGPDGELTQKVLTKYLQEMWDEKLSPQEAIDKVCEEIKKKRAACYRPQN